MTGSRAESADQHAWSPSQIRPPDGAPPVKVDWVVRKNGDSELHDRRRRVDGVSMVLTQREEIAAVIERNGGGVTGLNKAIGRQARQRPHTSRRRARRCSGARRSDARQRLVADAVRLVGVGAEPALAVGLVVLRSCPRTRPPGCRLRRRGCAWRCGRGTSGRG